MKLLKYLFTIILLLSVSLLQAQRSNRKAALNEKYERIKNNMQQAYDDGDMNQTSEIYYEQCCKMKETSGAKTYTETSEFKTVSNQIKARIYHLVALAAISMDTPGQGEEYLKKLFALEYERTFDNDWLTVRAQRQKYHVAPQLLLGISAGQNISFAHAYNSYSLLHPTANGTTDLKDYAPWFGSQIGLVVEYGITKNLFVDFQLASSKMRFKYTKEHKWGNENFIGLKNIHTSQLSYLETPVVLKYQFISKINPFLSGGFFYGRLQEASKHLEYTVSENTYGFFQSNTYERPVVMEELIEPNHWGLIAGAGFGFSIGKNHFVIEACYKHGFQNVVKSNNRIENKELTYRFYDVMDDIKLRSLTVSVSYLYPLTYKAFKK